MVWPPMAEAISRKAAEVVAQGITERQGVSALDSLSRREREVLRLVADGYSSAKIGELLTPAE